MYFLNTNIPNNLICIKSFSHIYGLNLKTSLIILKEFGLTKKTKINDLPIELKNNIIKYIEKNFIFGDKLKQHNNNKIKILKNIRCYRGLRTIIKLPRRGQRTHTNAKTVKKI